MRQRVNLYRIGHIEYQPYKPRYDIVCVLTWGVILLGLILFWGWVLVSIGLAQP